MFPHANFFDPTLINTVGHTAGVILFGLIIILLVREGRLHGTRQIRMSLVAAVLAFAWNIGSLIAIGLVGPQWLAIGLVPTASFAVLSLLPAVLFQVTLQGKYRWLVVCGYCISLCAATLHFCELFLPYERLHQLALLLIVAGFGILTGWAFGLGVRQNGRVWSRAEWFSLGCLLLFTTSFIHFGYEHVTSPWAAEIAWHHLGIPVALIVLLRDYRLLLLDTFVRFVVNSALAALYVAGFFALNLQFRLTELATGSPFWAGLSLVGFCLSLILFVYLRNECQQWVSRVVFRRQNAERCVQTISELALRAKSEDELLNAAAGQVARHFGTDWFVIDREDRSEQAAPRPSIALLQEEADVGKRRFRAEAQMPLRFSGGDAKYLLLGTRRGGRRYLSEDMEDMQRLGGAITEQVERLRADELRRLASEAEIRALQAQINPHFLFNALNALYGTIDRQSQTARRLVLNLADIFRYLLHGERTMISLAEELRIVRAYLEIEQVRLGERLETSIYVSDLVKETSIPILSIQPLVENAVKHGVAPKHGLGRVAVRAERSEGGVRITVEDSGGRFDWSKPAPTNGTGLGLQNVRRRLFLCYGSAGELQIRSNDESTVVTFLVPERKNEQDEARELSLQA